LSVNQGHDLTLEFATSADLVCGIELKTAGYRLSWSLVDYWEGVEQELAQAMKQLVPTS